VALATTAEVSRQGVSGTVRTVIRTPLDEAALHAAIDRLTRALATADDETIAELVAERRSLREELRELLQVDAGVVRLDGARVRRRDP
jgi:hypothetical protein